MIEINLIPDVKNELLKTQSLRNRIILFSIVASIACVVLVVLVNASLAILSSQQSNMA
jgi:hypothetical protein